MENGKSGLIWFIAGGIVVLLVVVAVKCRNEIVAIAGLIWQSAKPLTVSVWGKVKDIFSSGKEALTTQVVEAPTPNTNVGEKEVIPTS